MRLVTKDCAKNDLLCSGRKAALLGQGVFVSVKGRRKRSQSCLHLSATPAQDVTSLSGTWTKCLILESLTADPGDSQDVDYVCNCAVL